VVLGLALLAALLILFSKGTSPFSRTYELRLHASNVGGLKERAGVLLAGVQVGGVSSIQLAEDGKSVTILLNIYKGCKIYRDARFIIEQSGFLGDEYVSIIPTSNAPPVLVSGDEVNCQEPFNLQEVARSASGFIQRIDDTAKKLDDSVTDLRRVVLNEQALNNFSATLHNLRTVSEQAMGTVNEVNALVATNGPQINFAVSNVAFFSQELLRLASSAEVVLATNSTDITAAVKNIESSTEVLKDLLNSVQSGKGLAGTVLEDEQLTTNVQAIANNFAIASSNLNRLGLWHLLWHKEPVPAPPGGTTTTNSSH
jgi:phospholipid/cholesterol/gamma-HCH transport system substrate-binding protein